jgi:histidine ammonia-lyase
MERPLRTLRLGEAAVSHRDVARVARGQLAVVLSDEGPWRERMRRTRQAVDERAAGPEPFYGVNTGFGASCVNAVSAAFGLELAQNLVRFHGCGVGPPFGREEGRAVLVARLAQLAAGGSGIRLPTLEAMVRLLAEDIVPCIPELGSVGASGDLTPMSYVAAVLGGDREVYFRGRICPAREALAAVGLPPIELGPKESLSIMNGTSVMTGLVALGLARAEAFVRAHATLTAWASFLLRGQAAHFDERLFLAKPHPGSMRYAAWVRAALASGPRPPPAAGKVQDPYSIRCAPQVVGVLVEVLAQAAATVEIELNGANDNPILCSETGDVLHGGNFYGGHIAHAADSLKLQVAHAAEVLERQLVLLCHAPPAAGLPENLVAATGEGRSAHHGFKAMEILASALVAEALKLAAPASAYSRSTEGGNQDKVPMGALGARELGRILELAELVLAVGLLAAAQATDVGGRRAELPPPLAALYRALRALDPRADGDRPHDALIARCLAAYRAGELPLPELP